MFEAFMFINPIGTSCYQVEQIMMKTIANTGLKASYHIVPVVTMRGIRNDLKRRQLPTSDIALFNEFSTAANDALRNYHAIKLIAGNKKARSFVIDLQSAINDKCEKYTPELVKNLISDLNLCPKTIEKTLVSQYLQESIDEDQRLAKKYNIQETPTTVVFDDQVDQVDYLIEGSISDEELTNLVSPLARKQVCLSDRVLPHNPHLHLL